MSRPRTSITLTPYLKRRLEEKARALGIAPASLCSHIIATILRGETLKLD